ncbi:nucleotide exchange factor GrpE [Candidatus Peregrinibacteria bacterium]|jgi:molecular chaperone GrpE|nr:nucleotide exchange factor GrpE [Candidatus Peregrinibacteria bacterium]MBT4148482.1 nucleotide exchange factor GrpE [Candidatus Peregrinibacteria bacterium]MBT4366661.1 nucleotide exchange factor GrpE [Candidatus Peregrinibacteria bacterium]MBT4456428.1 nucleotide exchange factor GrpE [Candidatus Peregrinibacteria bacterium]
MTKDKSKSSANPPAQNDTELLKLKLKDAEQKLEQMTELGRRAIADMENMKRRVEEDRSRMALFANIELVRAILPVVDNFKRAQAHTPEDLSDTAKEWLQGVTQTLNQLTQALEQAGVKEIEALGQQFDPNRHEAIVQDKGPQNQVLEVLEPGYKIGDQVIRPAKVKVGMGE